MTERVVVRFEPLGVELAASAGERVLDVADECPERVLPVACRAANCGTCLVSVQAGRDLLQPPSRRERQALHALGAAGREQRLGCQVRINSTTKRGRVVVLLPLSPRLP